MLLAMQTINYWEMINIVSKLIELRLKKEALQKKLEQVESELELIYFQIDEEMERQQ